MELKVLSCSRHPNSPAPGPAIISLRVCVCCVFFYVLHTEYQNIRSTGKVRTFFFKEVRTFWLVFAKLRDCFRVKTWLGLGLALGLG